MTENRTLAGIEAAGLDRLQPGADYKATRFTRMKWLLADVVCVVCAVVLATQALEATDPNRQVGGLLGAGFFVVLGMLALGLTVRRQGYAGFRLINATVMTRAERPTADSWVYLAQTRATNTPLIVGFGMAALGSFTMSTYAGLQVFGVIPQVNEDVSSAGPALGMVFMGVLGLVLAWLTSLLIRHRYRDGRFGARPSGVALGAHGISVRVPGRDEEIPWGRIELIEARMGVVGEADPKYPNRDLASAELIWVGLAGGRALMFSGDNFRVQGDVLFTALRWYLAHPEARWELGRIEGERRLAAWCLAAKG